MFQLAFVFGSRVEWPLSVCLMTLLSIILDCCSASTFRGFLGAASKYATDLCD